MDAGDQRLHHLVPARSHNATSLRHELTRWAHAVALPEDTADAMVLAAYEAMINVVTHAYPVREEGPLELSAELRRDAVRVTVSDQGNWREPAAEPGPLHGRGLPLIHALAEHAEISPGPRGTTVQMRWPAPVSVEVATAPAAVEVATEPSAAGRGMAPAPAEVATAAAGRGTAPVSADARAAQAEGAGARAAGGPGAGRQLQPARLQ